MLEDNPCETCPLSMLCNSEAEMLRDELHGIGTSTMEASERYEATLRTYQEQQSSPHLEPGKGADSAEQKLEETISEFRENATSWVDTKLGRIASILAFKEGAQRYCPGPRERRKYYILGERVLKCSAKYSRLHYATLKLISILPRSGPNIN